MQFIVKLLISVVIIVIATQLGRRFPSFAGLIATMPLTGVIVLLWLHHDTRGDAGLMTEYTRGALWGIAPSVLFFTAAVICFRKQLPLTVVLPVSFGVWLAGAVVHQLLLR
jgi:uncharacterized membrane protein (GlpM family)